MKGSNRALSFRYGRKSTIGAERPKHSIKEFHCRISFLSHPLSFPVVADFYHDEDGRRQGTVELGNGCKGEERCDYRYRHWITLATRAKDEAVVDDGGRATERPKEEEEEEGEGRWIYFNS